ncbi:MAG: histidine kinase dimerization/phospho-acceptor domain-containing protein, partial [Acidobacteriota bacterium]
MRELTIANSALVAEYLERTRFVHVLRFDHAGVILSANDAMARHLGSSGTLLRGRAVFDFLTDPDAALIRARLEAPAFASDPTALNFCDADGAPFTLVSFLTVSDDGGVLIGEPSYADEQRLQQQLLEVNEELASLARSRHRSTLLEQQERLHAEADNRAKDEALAVIAHELRQPLNAALAALGLLRKNPAGAVRVHAILERQIRQMSTIVEDLLHASKV